MTKWNWQKEDWPNFTYDAAKLQKFEEKFLYNSGLFYGVEKHLNQSDLETLRIELILDEALKTSEIEGEFLNRDSLQSSICRNFGLTTDHRRIPPGEKAISDMISDLYHNFDTKLTHKTLFKWHKMLMNARNDIKEIGKYRQDQDPMQIISGRLDEPTIHFEAPPSKDVKTEMDQFINWFNDSNDKLKPLTRAAIAHLYFVTIHPFEDGNGRIARALTIKALSQSNKKPLLTSFSTIIQNNKKPYYNSLAQSNYSNEITNWITYMAQTLITSQEHTQNTIEFLIAKTKLYERLKNQLNSRQEKILHRLFKEGITGFKGGLSAKNYITITKTSRATATRDLQDLVDKKALTKTGQLKAARYFLNL